MKPSSIYENLFRPQCLHGNPCSSKPFIRGGGNLQFSNKMDPKMQIMEKNFVSSTESFAEPAPVATGESLTPEERTKQVSDEWKKL